MNHVAVVVQRCHESIIGGSESLAWQYAELLNGAFSVDILTTTALDYTTWSNDLTAGAEDRDGITIRRFPVSITRSSYWHELHARWLRYYPYSGRGEPRDVASQDSPWTVGLEEEFIRKQGPYSHDLISFLRTNEQRYRAIIFVTYLYPTTYFGSAVVSRSRSVLVPTLHDEPAAYMKAFKLMARSMRAVLWLTEAERELSQNLWGTLPGAVIALPVNTDQAQPAKLGYPYLLYCGRIDEGKGSFELINYFTQMKKAAPSPLRLVLTGQDKIGVPAHPDIDYLGHVSDADKAELMAGAQAFVMPSRWESFSIATLEAMAQGTPALVNADCRVLCEHVIRSRAGACFNNSESFATAVANLCRDGNGVSEMRTRARDYVINHYERDRIRAHLIRWVASCRPKKGLKTRSTRKDV
jgi:glycosyltransferase involved in cell wall biosynthesis